MPRTIECSMRQLSCYMLSDPAQPVKRVATSENTLHIMHVTIQINCSLLSTAERFIFLDSGQMGTKCGKQDDSDIVLCQDNFWVVCKKLSSSNS